MAASGIDRVADGRRATDHRLRSTRQIRYPRSKRMLDLTLGSIGIVAVTPLLAVIRMAMLASGDHGPFLYRAERIGEGGAIITVLKIRTMIPGAGGAMLTKRGDPRVTLVGKRIRGLRLDELPQLVNVLRGDMALVGPRPEDPSFIDLGDPLHRRVFLARPGVTGLAQLEFRNESALLGGPDADRTYRETILPAKLRLDERYLENQSIWLDLKIIARTVAAILGRGDTH